LASAGADRVLDRTQGRSLGTKPARHAASPTLANPVDLFERHGHDSGVAAAWKGVGRQLGVVALTRELLIVLRRQPELGEIRPERNQRLEADAPIGFLTCGTLTRLV